MFYARLFFKYLLALFWFAGGVNHFINTDFYLTLMPDYIPAHRAMVLLSGVTEIVAGILVATPRLTKWGAWLCIAQLVVFFTVHIDMIVHAADKFPDIPIATLWIRIPIQFLFIFWAWWFTRDPKGRVASHEVSP